MGSQLWKWFTSTENAHRGSIIKNYESNSPKEEDNVLIRSSTKLRSSMGAYSNMSSIICRNLPARTVENNKHFHTSPDNSMFTEIVKNKAVKILPMEFSEMEEYFADQLVEWKHYVEQYSKLLDASYKSQRKDPTLLMEIISGQDIDWDKGKFSPFVEVFQNVGSQSSPSEGKFDADSTKGTDRVESFYDVLRKSEAAAMSKQGEGPSSSKLVLSTPIPIKPNKEGVFEWWRFFQMCFENDWSEKERTFTIGLYRAKKNKSKWEKLGKSRSFYLVHLKNQELKETMLEFKDSYEAQWQGRVLIRMQYVYDKSALYREIFESYEHRKDLIEQSIEILHLQRQSHLKRAEQAIAFDYIEMKNPEWGSHNEGFYSEIGHESYLECNSSPQKNKYLEKEFFNSLRSYDLTEKNMSFCENGIEPKSR